VTDSLPATGQEPRGIDTTVPHSARVWNYWLGGKDNYPVDRAVGDRVMALGRPVPMSRNWRIPASRAR
jgi:S-adenosyl methyltransferase